MPQVSNMVFSAQSTSLVISGRSISHETTAKQNKLTNKQQNEEEEEEEEEEEQEEESKKESGKKETKQNKICSKFRTALRSCDASVAIKWPALHLVVS